jgi:hypothetical protein
MFPIAVVIRMHDAAGGCEPDHQNLHFLFSWAWTIDLLT